MLIICRSRREDTRGYEKIREVKLEEAARYKKRSEYTRSRSNFQKFTGQECDLCIYDGTYLGPKTSRFSEVFTCFKQKLLTISGFLGILSTVEVVP